MCISPPKIISLLMGRYPISPSPTGSSNPQIERGDADGWGVGMDERESVKLVRAFASSELRMNILLCLKNESKDIKDLQTELGGRNTTILHALRDMSDSDLVARDRDGYKLTNLGKLKAGLLSEILRTLNKLEERPGYWLNHDISGIPSMLLERIGMLFQSEIIFSDPSEPLKCHQTLESMLARSKSIRAVLPALIFPKGSDAFISALRRGSGLDLLLTEEVTGFLITEDGVLDPEFKKSFKFDNFRLRLSRDYMKLVLVVTESFVYLGLFREDGVYDIASGTIYTGECAVTWGTKLFEYYADGSVGLDEERLLEMASSQRRVAAAGTADNGHFDGEDPALDGSEAIILVEDDVGHAALIHRIFEESGSRREFHHLANLREALRWIEMNRCRTFLVIADYLLPDGCGLDLTGNAEHPEEVGFPLVILTGYGSEKIAVAAFKSGAMDYVIKDAESMQKLPEIAREALQKWRKRARRYAADEGLKSLEAEKANPLNSLTMAETHDNRQRYEDGP